MIRNLICLSQQHLFGLQSGGLNMGSLIRGGAYLRMPPALCFLVLAAVACSCSGGSEQSAVGSTDLESTTAVKAFEDGELVQESFSLARATLAGVQIPAGALDELPGTRSFVCVYGDALDQLRSICATGTGDTMAASLGDATHQLAQRLGSRAALMDGCLFKIDVVIGAENCRLYDVINDTEPRDVGRFGLWLEANGEISYVLPSEFLEEGLWTEQGDEDGIELRALLAVLRRRNVAIPPILMSPTCERFQTVSWVEGASGGAGSRPVFRIDRVHPAERPELAPDTLLQRIVWAADYLVSVIGVEGRYRYHYSVAGDRVERGYNLLRHAGTTYSLFQAFRRTDDPAYLEAGERATSYLLNRCQRGRRVGHYGGGEVLYVVESKRVKLGGSALTLLALNEHANATGDFRANRENARALARFLVAMQKPDGEFICFPGLNAGDPPLDKTSLYYPGEAIFALAQFYSWDRDPLWLDTAERAATWLITVRDAEIPVGELWNDHWLMLGMRELYRLTENQLYLEHSLKLARAVENKYQTNAGLAAEYPDYLGGYYDPPRSTPAATRSEGLLAVLGTCRLAGVETRWIERVLDDTIRHQMLFQYTPDMLWWVPRPDRAAGGWMGGVVDSSIRIDFVQHNMSAMLGMEEVLRLRLGMPLGERAGPGRDISQVP